jgi:L-histidine Nalpha-methyltransferase / hercynylcysteine S-oxide synthase
MHSRPRPGPSAMKRYVMVCVFALGPPFNTTQYARYMYDTSIEKVPASWAESVNKASHTVNGYTNGHSSASPLPGSFLSGKSVRTIFGLVPLKYALDWPVFASYDELAGCAAWMGGRIPMFEETRSIYAHVNALKKKKEVERQLGKTVPAVNG